MLNKIFIQRKIKLIQEDLEKVAPLAQTPLNNLVQNAVEFAAAERFLERIITRAVDTKILFCISRTSVFIRKNLRKLLRRPQGCAMFWFMNTTMWNKSSSMIRCNKRLPNILNIAVFCWSF
ncbi:MAG TPA: hypothetical protein VJC20_04240 [Candidatus Paceibacterota bacterium]